MGNAVTHMYTHIHTHTHIKTQDRSTRYVGWGLVAEARRTLWLADEGACWPRLENLVLLCPPLVLYIHMIMVMVLKTKTVRDHRGVHFVAFMRLPL